MRNGLLRSLYSKALHALKTYLEKESDQKGFILDTVHRLCLQLKATFFRNRGLTFNENQHRTLKRVNSNGLYTNLALFLSELHIVEWLNLFSTVCFGYSVLAGNHWSLEFEYANNHKLIRFSGDMNFAPQTQLIRKN